MERAIEAELPANYEIETNDSFAGPGDFLERYDLIFPEEDYRDLIRRVDLSTWERSAAGSGHEREVRVGGEAVVLYLVPERRALIYVRPER